MKIWCLFSVDNNYDQPDHNLVCFWAQKPSLEQLAAALGYNLKDVADETVVGIVGIWTGRGGRVPHNDTEYRLEEVEEGHKL